MGSMESKNADLTALVSTCHVEHPRDSEAGTWPFFRLTGNFIRGSSLREPWWIVNALGWFPRVGVYDYDYFLVDRTATIETLQHGLQITIPVCTGRHEL